MAKKALTEKSLKVLEFLKEHDGENLTAADIAIGMGFADKDDEASMKAGTQSINGTVTGGLQKKGYTRRVPATATLEDGTTKPVKIIELTDEGRAYDHQAAVAEDAASAE